jgi:hypothetical protein
MGAHLWLAALAGVQSHLVFGGGIGCGGALDLWKAAFQPGDTLCNTTKILRISGGRAAGSNRG